MPSSLFKYVVRLCISQPALQRDCTSSHPQANGQPISLGIGSDHQTVLPMLWKSGVL